MKRKTVIIIIASLAFLAVAGAVIWLIASSKKNTPLYGTFVYTNADGSVATVTITEQNAHFENVDFTSAQQNAAFFWAVEEFKEAERELNLEELGQRQDEILSVMDFDSLFQGKTVDYTETKFVDDVYIYYIINEETGPDGLVLIVNPNSKKLSIAGNVFALQK